MHITDDMNDDVLRHFERCHRVRRETGYEI